MKAASLVNLQPPRPNSLEVASSLLLQSRLSFLGLVDSGTRHLRLTSRYAPVTVSMPRHSSAFLLVRASFCGAPQHTEGTLNPLKQQVDPRLDGQWGMSPRHQVTSMIGKSGAMYLWVRGTHEGFVFYKEDEVLPRVSEVDLVD